MFYIEQFYSLCNARIKTKIKWLKNEINEFYREFEQQSKQKIIDTMYLRERGMSITGVIKQIQLI